MQLMPATAEEVAGNLGLPYARGRLTSDWEYNATLGAAYLAYLTEEFGPTPVMIAAGYNAGPSRPKSWMDERGDPRLREMDVVDWIEHIPFRETRNYVMRVTESIPIYRARLTGQTELVRFTDLLIGSKPILRPVARPDRAVQPTIRPVARP
jgi:soluble lytic murein transglycosylase